MGKKKGSKKGKKGGKKGKKDGAGGDDKKVELLKRFQGGYLKRCTKCHDQAPLPSVCADLTASIKGGTPLVQMLLVEETLIGPEATSRLDPLVNAVIETGYTFLTQLFVWNTDFRNIEMLVLAQWVETPKCTLEVIEFMDNDLTPFACGRLGEALAFNKIVKSLSILHNDIGDDGVAALCKGIAFNQTLEALHLEYCDIEADGCEAVGRHIATNGSIKSIYLNGNNVEGAGAMHLVRSLACNRHLERLELQDNAIDCHATEYATEDIVTVIESLATKCATNTSIAYIDLFENDIGDIGGQAVLDFYTARKDAGLPTINIRVAPRMRAELYDSIAKGTKWVSGGGKSKKAGGKKKGGKKKKKK